MKLALACAMLFVAIPTIAQNVDCSTPRYEKKITITSPTVFTGTLEDNKNSSIAMKGIVLRGVDKKAPPVSLVAVTDSKGAFHFDSVPAGKYAITIDFTGMAVKKADVHCTTADACRVTLVVRSVVPRDCYRGHYYDFNGGSAIR